MEWRGVTRWIGPPPNVRLTIESWRVWRWSEGDVQAAGDPAAADIAASAPGFLDPGLALFNEARQPVCAIGRHARRLQPRSANVDGAAARRDVAMRTVEDALLVPDASRPYHGATWKLAAIGRTVEGGSVSLRDPSGVERAHVTNPRRFTPGIDGAELTVGTQAWRVTEARDTLLGGKSIVRFIAGGSIRAEARAEDGHSTEGDMTRPIHVRWESEPDPWAQGVMLLLVAIWVDSACPDGPGVVIPPP